MPVSLLSLKAIDELTALPGNARQHPPAQIAALADSIARYGWLAPVIIDESGLILAGHGRIAAAQKLGLLEAPCIIADGLSDDAKKAYALVDNRLNELSQWDTTGLERELELLAQMGVTEQDLYLSLPAPEEVAPAVPPELAAPAIPQPTPAVPETPEPEPEPAEPQRPQAHTVRCPQCAGTFTVYSLNRRAAQLVQGYLAPEPEGDGDNGAGVSSNAT